MTLVIVILLGAGVVIMLSGVETDPTTGKSVSILDTVKHIWDGSLDVSQPAPQTSDPTQAAAAPQPVSAEMAYTQASTAAYLQQRNAAM